MKGLADPRPVGKLEARILRALRSGSTMDFTTKNIAKALKLHQRKVRRELKRLQALKEIRQDIEKGEAALWRAP
jgi:predicted ArsR family transcriptional regulator